MKQEFFKVTVFFVASCMAEYTKRGNRYNSIVNSTHSFRVNINCWVFSSILHGVFYLHG